ncbi:hypothetical protein [Oerskovia enterophila]|uniref:hypothetical protein n=1 Tax=Oerskovia enterophila TaxID=43678 RepID=UPI0033913544
MVTDRAYVEAPAPTWYQRAVARYGVRMGSLGFYSVLVLLYVVVIAAVAVLVIWALVLTIQLLRSVLAERRAREAAATRAAYEVQGPRGPQGYGPAPEHLG